MTKRGSIGKPDFLEGLGSDDHGGDKSPWSDAAPVLGDGSQSPVDIELTPKAEIPEVELSDDDIPFAEPSEVEVTESEVTESEATDADDYTRRERPLLPRWLMIDGSAFLVSMNTHLLLLIVLALWTMPTIIDELRRPLLVSTDESEPIDKLETIFLEDLAEAAVDTVYTASAASMTAKIDSMVSSGGMDFDPKPIEDTKLGLPKPSGDGLANDLAAMTTNRGTEPEATLGEARVVVDDYQQVMDRITSEILKMLEESKVLVVWCFDESISMKDDQQEISQRIERVYAELGLSEKAGGDMLTTGVASFGQGFHLHTKRPTNDVELVRRAINAVPVDNSGLEMTMQAVSMSLAAHAKYAKGSKRKVALILVTDESGEMEPNIKFLESTVAEAKSVNCKVFVLGREAVFGYPYAHMRWKHPHTGHTRWLLVNRGPETSFVESLQTSCFRARHDSHPSGYGPYELSRLAEQTGGIFFMLPTIETDLVQVQKEKRRYRLDAMENYGPDLRSREEIFAERDESLLRAAIWGIINDLNPYDPETAKIINLKMHFQLRPDQFLEEARQEQAKAKVYITYIDRALKTLAEIEKHRDAEYQMRWRANYDLLYAQLLAYQARVYEYGAALDHFIANPKTAPMYKGQNARLVNWAVRLCKETKADDVTAETIAKANERFAKVINDHPDTPWATRAEWEVKRGYGIELVPNYHGPPRPYNGPKIPVPKL